MTSLQHLVMLLRLAWARDDREAQLDGLDALIETARRLRDEITRPAIAQGDVPPRPEKKAGFQSKSIHG